MTSLGAKYVMAHPNLFIHYEKNMVKSITFLNYYHNVYERWCEQW
jgi:hypothetical protein